MKLDSTVSPVKTVSNAEPLDGKYDVSLADPHKYYSKIRD